MAAGLLLLAWLAVKPAFALTYDTETGGDTGDSAPVTDPGDDDTGASEAGPGRLEWAETIHGFSAAEWSADPGGKACAAGPAAGWSAVGCALVLAAGRRRGGGAVRHPESTKSPSNAAS